MPTASARRNAGARRIERGAEHGGHGTARGRGGLPARNSGAQFRPTVPKRRPEVALPISPGRTGRFSVRGKPFDRLRTGLSNHDQPLAIAVRGEPVEPRSTPRPLPFVVSLSNHDQPLAIAVRGEPVEPRSAPRPLPFVVSLSNHDQPHAIAVRGEPVEPRSAPRPLTLRQAQGERWKGKAVRGKPFDKLRTGLSIFRSW